MPGEDVHRYPAPSRDGPPRLPRRRQDPLARWENLPPAAQPVFWFGGLILLGTFLLALPAAHAGAALDTDPLTPLFMATSAVCVTGLSVVAVNEYYSLFGQAVLAVLIEMGGLGLMTFASVGFQLFGRRLSLASQAALDDALFWRGSAAEFKRTFGGIVRLVLGIQAAGAVWLFAVLLPRHVERGGGALDAAWSALFHAVSAFCNAGLSLYPDSLEGFSGQPWVLAPFMVLIVLGGLGHAALVEAGGHLRLWWRMKRARRRSHGMRSVLFPTLKPMSLHTRVVLAMTLLVGAAGTALLLLIGRHGSLRIDSLDALFHCFSSRTAGMNSVPMAEFGVAGLTLLCLLMFVGGSPGSCAGGIKTTSLAIWLSALGNGLRGKSDVTLFGRVILPELVAKARLLIGLSCVFNILGVMLLCMTEANAPAGLPEARATAHRMVADADGKKERAAASAEAAAAAEAAAEEEENEGLRPPPVDQATGRLKPAWGLIDLLFEQISAFATVGLSTGVTPTLSPAGKLWVIFSMFVGRLGPLGIALWIMPAPKARVRGAHGRVMIG